MALQSPLGIYTVLGQGPFQNPSGIYVIFRYGPIGSTLLFTWKNNLKAQVLPDLSPAQAERVGAPPQLLHAYTQTDVYIYIQNYEH